MSFITAALIGGGAAILGGVIASSGARSAASTQADAATRSGELQKQMYDEQSRLNAPYREAGLTGQNRLMELLGLGGNRGAAGYGQYANAPTAADIQTDPGYAFRLAEGQKALDRQAAARGGLISGGALKAATRYGQDMGSQEYTNAFNRYQTNRTNALQPLANLQSVGVNATNQQAAQAGQYGVNAGNAINQAGQSIAAGQLGAGNTYNNALGTAASAYQTQSNFNDYMKQLNMNNYYSQQASNPMGPPASAAYL